jgi:hypothetical protein
MSTRIDLTSVETRGLETLKFRILQPIFRMIVKECVIQDLYGKRDYENVTWAYGLGELVARFRRAKSDKKRREVMRQIASWVVDWLETKEK